MDVPHDHFENGSGKSLSPSFLLSFDPWRIPREIPAFVGGKCYHLQETNMTKQSRRWWADEKIDVYVEGDKIN